MHGRGILSGMAMSIGCLSLCSMALAAGVSAEVPAAVIADGAREHLDGLVTAMLRALPRPEIDQARALLADISALVPDAPIDAARIRQLITKTRKLAAKDMIESYERSLCVAVLRELGRLGGPATLVELAKVRAAVEADQSDYQKWYWACKAKVALSGYPSDLYDSLYGKWRVVRFRTRILAARHSRAQRIDALWMNW